MNFLQYWPLSKLNILSTIWKNSINKDIFGNNKNDSIKNETNVIFPLSTTEALRAHYQNIVEKNFPKDFNEKFQRGMPFVGASFIFWPIFWLYRGLDWGYQRQYVTLPVYIQKTYLQAKVIQVAILITGVLIAASQQSGPPYGLHEITNKYDDITRNF